MINLNIFYLVLLNLLTSLNFIHVHYFIKTDSLIDHLFIIL
jgi:hypothetical protein